MEEYIKLAFAAGKQQAMEDYRASMEDYIKQAHYAGVTAALAEAGLSKEAIGKAVGSKLLRRAPAPSGMRPIAIDTSKATAADLNTWVNKGKFEQVHSAVGKNKGLLDQMNPDLRTTYNTWVTGKGSGGRQNLRRAISER